MGREMEEMYEHEAVLKMLSLFQGVSAISASRKNYIIIKFFFFLTTFLFISLKVKYWRSINLCCSFIMLHECFAVLGRNINASNWNKKKGIHECVDGTREKQNGLKNYIKL